MFIIAQFKIICLNTRNVYNSAIKNYQSNRKSEEIKNTETNKSKKEFKKYKEDKTNKA